MNRERLTNRELDELGRKLVVAAAPDEREIDHLVSNPRLFDGTLAKIAASNVAAREPRRRPSLVPVAAAAAVVAVFSISLLAFLRYSDANEPVLTKQIDRPSEVVTKPSVRETNQPTAVVAQEPGPVPVPAIFKRPESTKTRPLPKDRLRKPEPQPKLEPAFHPIGFAERAQETVIDGRVVRVDMPRSALFALGIDLPLENGMHAVRAELLVGADGVPRGIRLVE
ncbi:MAG: hypothetical protein AB7F88_11635 [Pyrinomonadaceae bacterium]